MWRELMYFAILAALLTGCASPSGQRSVRSDYLSSGSSGKVRINADSSLCYYLIIEMPDHEALGSILDMPEFRENLASEIAGSVFTIHTAKRIDRIVINSNSLDTSVLNFSGLVSFVLRGRICDTDQLEVAYAITSSKKGARYVVVIEVDPAHYLY